MTKQLEGHVSVITGGNGGIGLGMAMGLVAAGANIAIWGTSEEKNESAADVLKELGAEVLALQCDVRDQSQVEEAFATTVRRFGKVDSVFANAGLGGSGASSITELTLDEWRSMFAVNVEGVFLTLRAAARHMIERGAGGSLVVVSSTAAIHGAPRNTHYAASKSALLGLMRGLAVELARYHIRCNALVPGWTETGLTSSARQNEKFMENTTYRTPVRRWGLPQDFTQIAPYLADPQISFHTGDTFVVDGGYTIF
ncbi:MAG TPA: SDR family oxidoreductase [Acidimicrobiales bacterium]|nr:SDR family oxidoreductase [Acidimicrobiales bacterium]